MSELITIEQTSVATVFTTEAGPDPILEKITSEVRKFVPDISSEKGRKEIASLAYKVAKSKTYLDDLGASLVEDMKKQVKVVDSSRKKIRDYLDNLKTEVREPLTEWENKEKNRVAAHTENILKIETLFAPISDTPSDLIKEKIINLESLDINDSWEEFKDRAIRSKDLALKSLNESLSKRLKYESDQEELKKLREAEEKRKQEEHEKRIAEEAAQKAKLEAEQKAEEEKRKIEKEKQAEIEAREKAEKEKVAAEERAKKAEEDKKLAEEKAREEERKKIQEEKDAEEEAKARREADMEHRRRINNEILNALSIEVSLSDEDAKKVIQAILTGKIPYTKINY